MRIKDLPIRQKIVSLIMLICAVVLVLMCTAYAIFEIEGSRDSIKANAETIGQIIAANSSAALAFDSPADAADILKGLASNKHIVAASLYNNKGDLFAKYPDTISSSLLPSKPGVAGYRFDKKMLIGFEPVLEKDEPLGTLYLQMDMETMYSRIKLTLMIAVLLIAGALLIAYILSKVLEKNISAPIMALEAVARSVSENQDYGVRAVKVGKDEIGSLTDTFNYMLGQIEKQNIEITQAQEASAKLAAIVESSEDAIIGQTLDGVITSWNQSAERMFGYNTAEMIGEKIFKLVPDTLLEEEAFALAELGKGNRLETFETQRLTRMGKLMYVSVALSPVYNAAGQVVGISETARDITEKKQEEIRKNDFLAIVSHELKTPLTSLRSYIQVLLALARKENVDFRISALMRAEVQVKKMANMVQDFLNLARLEGGKLQLIRERFEVQPFLQDIITETKLITTNHNLTFDECEGICVNADKDKIGQVMINLLSNAIKYSPKGGDIKISCEIIGSKLRIAVSDQGVGISHEDQKKLFNRFYRVKNEKVKTVSGFGIGLYLVAQIINSHNSKIQVHSQESKGTTFSFDLDIC